MSPPRRRENGPGRGSPFDPEPLWYKDAVIYELHVRAFHDSNGDGIGDFRGLTAKLDYLRDLGVTALWLLPFYPSPLKDDGYDTADYTGVHPSYGTLADFKAFLREAHARGLRVITELVLNHTSDQHPWFQRARRAPAGSPAREFYVWSDDPERYRETRIIFKDFEASNWSWDPVARAYYWHRFYAHQPDLNYDRAEVHRAVLKVLDFWLDLGVDGLRLDAVPYLYEREGTSCENLPETHAFLKRLREHVDARYEDRMLLAEANQWPEDAVAYFGGGKGDECHTAFHFPVMPRLFMAIRTENRFPIVDILEQTPEIPEDAQWVLFLRNHDELTLEMVTDEERDYMYRVYAHDRQARINLGIRRRLAPLLNNDRRKIELMNGLLFSLPGTPVIYYADEIGMGDNIYLGDRNGVRTPMQWSSDRNAGFSRANPQRLYLPVVTDPEYHYEAVNVEAQHANPDSMLWWTRRMIALRKRFKAFGRGTLEFVPSENSKVLAFLRCWQDESVLVVANLSRYAQHADLDLASVAGTVPVELFGRSEFPPIESGPWGVTLGPHAFLWFSLEPLAERAEAQDPTSTSLPELATRGPWTEVFSGRQRARLAEILTRRLEGQRWFRAKSRRIKGTEITEVVPLGSRPDSPRLAFLGLEFMEGEPQTYVIPVGFRTEAPPETRLAGLSAHGGEEPGWLVDALQGEDFQRGVLERMTSRKRFRGESGEIVTTVGRGVKPIRLSIPDGNELAPRLCKAEQTNSTLMYGERYVLKLYRAVEEGVNPDLEIGRFLTEHTGFRSTPRVVGSLEYDRDGERTSLGMLQEFVPNQGDAWQYTLDYLGRFLDRVLASVAEGREPAPGTPPDPLRTGEADWPAAPGVIGTYLESARLIGERTAELHAALASGRDREFLPEPFTQHYQRSLLQMMTSRAKSVLPLVRRRAASLPEPVATDARRLLELEPLLAERFKRLVDHKLDGMRIRVHGDYHLGQVLYTGKDFFVIDFEGEPARPMGERRLKRSPLRDVAGMLRSFHYAGGWALDDRLAGEPPRSERRELLEEWMRSWRAWVDAAFLRRYVEVLRPTGILPEDPGDVELLLDAYVLEKALYEIGYELDNRPEWVRIPLRGILGLLEEAD